MTTDTSSGNGGTAFLSFLVGALLVGVGVVGFFMWDNYKSHTGGGAAAPSATITVKKN